MSLDPASSGVFNCRPASQTAEVFKIIITSDVHLGYAERDALRGDDSFRAFEEVLQAAQKHDVDLILLAGDLFHVNKPTISTMNRASALIRKYCFDEYDDATARFKIQNHPRANLKVRCPIFTIHGNRGDSTGVNQMNAIEVLDSSGLLNYIGKRSHVDDVVLKPIVLEKGPLRWPSTAWDHCTRRRGGTAGAIWDRCTRRRGGTAGAIYPCIANQERPGSTAEEEARPATRKWRSPNISASSVSDKNTEEDSSGEARAKITSYFKRTGK